MSSGLGGDRELLPWPHTVNPQEGRRVDIEGMGAAQRSVPRGSLAEPEEPSVTQHVAGTAADAQGEGKRLQENEQVLSM